MDLLTVFLLHAAMPYEELREALKHSAQMILNFLKNSNEWIFQAEKLFIPNALGDGFYYSLLRKK